MLKLLALSLLVPVASPIAVQNTTVTPVEKTKKEKKLCRRETATGSVMSKSVCHSKAEWAAIDVENEGGADTFRNGLNQGAAGPVR